MSIKIQHILVSYDIHDPQRLQRVGKALTDYGERVLKSVFECHLPPGQFQRLKNRVDGLIDHTEDSVRFYFICDKCLNNVEFSGAGCGFVPDPDVILA